VRRLAFIAALPLVLLPRLAGAEEEELVEEIFLGELPFAQEQGELQLTVAGDWRHAPDEERLTLPLVAEAGLTDWLQLEVETAVGFAWSREADRRGLEGLEVGALANVLHLPDAGFFGSVAAEVGFPVAAEGIGERAWSFAPGVSLLQRVGPLALSLSAAPELSWPTEPEEDGEDGEDESEPGTEVEGEIALAILVPLGDVVPVLEGRLEVGEELGGAVSCGVLWHPADGLELGVATRFERAEDQNAAGVTLSLTRAWELGEDVDD
jgi:hypothetical protein